MKENRNRRSNFEEKLLDELKGIVAQRSAEQEASAAEHPPTWRRAPRLAFGAGAALAAAAAVLVVSSGSGNTPKAFAVERQDGGGVTIRIYSPEDGTGLEETLAEAGIRSEVTWLPTGMACREPRFTQSSVTSPLGGSFGGFGAAGPGKAMTIGLVSSREWHEHRQAYLRGEITGAEYEPSANIVLDPASFRPDQTMVISGSRGRYSENPEGGFEMRIGIAEGPVEPCEPINAPDGGILDAMNRAIEAEASQGTTEPGTQGEAGSPGSSATE